MSDTFRAVVLRGKGDVEQLQEEVLPLVAPGAGAVRIRVTASGAGFTDITMRTGYYPYRPPFPFVQGYEALGVVDAVGPGVTGFRAGQRVCALTVSGGWGEYLVLPADELVPVPDGLDEAEVIALILNYVTAYQAIHRVAALEPGHTALVTGANGGVGTALLELLRLHGVRAIGACSRKRFDYVRKLGGEPIESRGESLAAEVRKIVPEGVDAAFDGLGGSGTSECVGATKKGGIVVSYGFMAARTTLGALSGFLWLFVGAPLRGRRSDFYGITKLYRADKAPFKEDLSKLFEYLAAGKLRPVIAAKLPLLAGKEAQRLLEAGGVTGKIVLLA